MKDIKNIILAFKSDGKMEEIAFHLSLAIIIYLFFAFFLSTLSFVVGWHISRAFPILSFLLAVFIPAKLMSYSKTGYLKTAVFIGLLVLLFLASIGVSCYFFDNSWDGMWYHQNAIFALKNGWNPITSTMENYSTQKGFSHFIRQPFWGDCYTKFFEIEAANIYAIVGNIQSGKAVHFLLLFACFGYLYTFFYRELRNRSWGIALAGMVCGNPVMLCEIFTNYVDHDLYYAFVFIIFSMLYLELENNSSGRVDAERNYPFNPAWVHWFFFICGIVFLANIKVSGCAYAVVLLLLYLAYSLCKKKNWEQLKTKVTVYVIVAILCLLAGINPFLTNLYRGHHILYPFFGKEKMDIVEWAVPRVLKQKNRLERFVYCHFLARSRRDYVFKWPFSLRYESLKYDSLCYVGNHCGGFGWFGGGIILLTFLFLLPILQIDWHSADARFYAFIMFSIAVTIAINPACWWARLVPQLWLFPFLSVTMIYKYSTRPRIQRAARIALMVLLVLVVGNSYPIIQGVIKLNIDNRDFVQEVMRHFKESKKTPVVVSNGSLTYNAYYFTDKKIDFLFFLKTDTQKLDKEYSHCLKRMDGRFYYDAE